MEVAKKARKPARAQLTKLINDIRDEMALEAPDKVVIRVKRDMLEKTFEKIDKLDKEILLLMAQSDATEDEESSEFAAITDYEESYRYSAVKIEEFLSKDEIKQTADGRGSSSRSSSPSSMSSRLATSKKSYKLPKFEVKKFDGSVSGWLGFWAQFNKIHEDDELHDSDKFQYLVQSMVPGSRACKLVASYPQSAENYQKVVVALKDRFGDKVLLTEVYVRQLIKMVMKTAGGLNIQLSEMYDELESHLRVLETLGVTQEQSAAFLYPLVESSLPEELIKVWQRSSMSGYGDDEEQMPEKKVDERLSQLMKFLRKEVKGAERLAYVREGVGNVQMPEKPASKEKKPQLVSSSPSTAAALVTQARTIACIFCDKAHESKDCGNAQSMSLESKMKKITEKKACRLCLKQFHVAKTCRAFVKCMICAKKHVTLMCPDLAANRTPANVENSVRENTKVQEVHSKFSGASDVMLQTLSCLVKHGEKTRLVKILLDSGSQRSYILETVAAELGLVTKGEVQLCHLLFGGSKQTRRHNRYTLQVGALCGSQLTFIDILGHDHICEKIPTMMCGSWMTELQEKGINIHDQRNENCVIDMLIGADYYTKILTGRIERLSNGLVAMETCWGWTVSGVVQNESYLSCAMEVTSLHVNDASVAELWKLDTIGIMDPVHQTSQDETRERFMNTVTRMDDGRYKVCLPWSGIERQIPNNRATAMQRLVSTTSKLEAAGRREDYDKVFADWVNEDIIEVAEMPEEKELCYYLPHRAVFKPQSTTTPVRPVFDASCKSGRAPSLNQCMEKGPNMLELIPSIFLRFREKKFGVTADIRKAFQMIEVDEKDRDFLMFLWWENYEKRTVRVYRHKRVVFGVNCSPFLLAAVIELHLKTVKEEWAPVARKLQKSLYVDNCVTSVDTNEEYQSFQRLSVQIMAEAKMDLRQWECSSNEINAGSDVTKVLGLVWNKQRDTLSCQIPDCDVQAKLTKRVVLSFINQIFDPIGFACPAVLIPKLILQETWTAKLGWDEPLPNDEANKFRMWATEAHQLQNIEIPRHMHGRDYFDGNPSQQLHTFCDASNVAYATAVYLRSTSGDGTVTVQLLAAKSRLSPIKRPTIPRLELLACTIAARLAFSVKEALSLNDVPCFYWSDSTTALAWIRRNDEWGTFVGNRVREICSITNPLDWQHVPGQANPADLPSRGCSPNYLVQSRWWEGPDWLSRDASDWPCEHTVCDECVIDTERKHLSRDKPQMNVLIESHTCVDVVPEALPNADAAPWYLRLSSYLKTTRMIAWIRRFVFNCKARQKRVGELTVCEVKEAELTIFRLVQESSFPKDVTVINGISVVRSEASLYRVRTKMIHSEEPENFRYPVLLPAKHPIVELLIRWHHIQCCHAGVQNLMCKLRETVWILKARRVISKVVHRCIRCRRHGNKGFSAETAALPPNRVKMGNVFQVTGVDLAGPLFLKGGDKAYIVLFTCAVYRCVHLDIVTSLSTEAFLNSLERFINIRGRPSVIYSDNGTNFVGTVNLFEKMNWKLIEERTGVSQIKWIFNPPSAAWWGGWWERLIRVVKDLLKRMLGSAQLNYKQMRTCLSHVESVVNERPLTAIVEDQCDLVPLTPAMFLHGLRTTSFPESESIQATDVSQEYRRRKNIQSELRDRFRREYLSQLVQRATQQRSVVPKIGDVVLVGSDDKKRQLWPMGRILSLIEGRDGVVRVAKVKTAHGTLLRPLQRLYALEVSSDEYSDLVNVQSEGNDDQNKQDVGTDDHTSDDKTSQDLQSNRRMVTRPERMTKLPARFRD